ncbi:hypothetical protein C3L33_06593, partial [Rhododendron williamsianum]
IGRIYKEAIGLLRYEYGILDLKLRAYEELGLSKSTVIKLVGCCPSLLVGNVNKELIGVLEKLKAWEFGNDWTGGCLSCKSAYNWNRMLETMVPGKESIFWLEELLKLDLKMSEIYSFFLQNPQILAAKRAKNVCRAVCFLYEIGIEAEGIATIVANNIRVLGAMLSASDIYGLETKVGCGEDYVLAQVRLRGKLRRDDKSSGEVPWQR